MVKILTGKFDSVKVVESRTIYKGVTVDVLEFADGSRHERVYFKGSETVAIAAFTEDNKMVLTRQYRHPMGKVIYDIPAGGTENGETLKEAALRELEEETGYTAERLGWLGRFTWAPGAMSGMVELFFAKSLKPKGSFDPNEIANIELVDFDKVLRGVLKGDYIDSALIIAALLVATKKLVPC
jgi:ADP-ribose pyrophosphatase